MSNKIIKWIDANYVKILVAAMCVELFWNYMYWTAGWFR